MGSSIDLYIYDCADLIAKLKDKGAHDETLLNRILERCGTTFADKFVLLNNEYYDSENPYYVVSYLIDKAFKIENSFDVFVREAVKTEGISYVDEDSEAELLGLETDA